MPDVSASFSNLQFNIKTDEICFTNSLSQFKSLLYFNSHSAMSFYVNGNRVTVRTVRFIMEHTLKATHRQPK